MDNSRLTDKLDPTAKAIALSIESAGGRTLLVGGFVRDLQLGRASKDYDFEIYGLPLSTLEEILGKFGSVIQIGRAFGVLRLKGMDADFSLPRTDSKVGTGHQGFDVECDPHLDFATASLRRDLTINSMALDVLTEELLDPHGGTRDIEAKRLRATSQEHFSEDPLRALRVAQFAARFDMRPDEKLLQLCRALDLAELSQERIWVELGKALLLSARPSIFFEFLRETRLLRYFPELQALVGVPQDSRWHPEGDVWVHTMMVINEAALLRNGTDDLALMPGALCHDFGKCETTVEESGAIRSPGHDNAGVPLAEAFLARLRAPGVLTKQVTALVKHHLAPALFVKEGATAKGYRRLARKLDNSKVTVDLLSRVARADHLGRTTAEALRREFPALDSFQENVLRLQLQQQAPKNVVMGRHLLERGLTPSPEFANILQRCRDIQDETGWHDPQKILDRLGALDSSPRQKGPPCQ